MSRDRRLPAWLQRLRPHRNPNAVPTPPAETKTRTPRSSKTVDLPAWVDRLRPKQLEKQLNQQFRQFQARQSSPVDPAADDRTSLATQFDRVLSNLPQLLRVDRAEVERRFETFARNAKPEDIGKIIKRLPDMNRGPMREIWPKVRSLLDMIRDPSAAWTAKALAIGALVYLISPFDAIPDFIPFAGLIDDAALIVAVVATWRVSLISTCVSRCKRASKRRRNWPKSRCRNTTELSASRCSAALRRH